MKYSLYIDEPGRLFKSSVTGKTLKTQHRRVEIHIDGKCAIDFVRHNKHRPTSRYPGEVTLANEVLAKLNS